MPRKEKNGSKKSKKTKTSGRPRRPWTAPRRRKSLAPVGADLLRGRDLRRLHRKAMIACGGIEESTSPMRTHGFHRWAVVDGSRTLLYERRASKDRVKTERYVSLKAWLRWSAVGPTATSSAAAWNARKVCGHHG